MAQCKWCDRSGWLLKLSERGLCKSCDYMVGMEVSQLARIINESMEIVDKSKNLETRMARLDLVGNYCKELAKYHQKGIKTIDPSPIEFARAATELKDKIIQEHCSNIIHEATQKVTVATTPKSKINLLSKARMQLRELKNHAENDHFIDVFDKTLSRMIQEVQLDEFMEKAQKAAFKGNKKKALDWYYEALYFLRHDDIDDSKQKSEISTIEQKIKELDGEVPD